LPPRVLILNCSAIYCSEGFLCEYAAMWHARAAVARRHFIEHVGGVHITYPYFKIKYYLSFYAINPIIMVHLGLIPSICKHLKWGHCIPCWDWW
jgi:hypothetical protein